MHRLVANNILEDSFNKSNIRIPSSFTKMIDKLEEKLRVSIENNVPLWSTYIINSDKMSIDIYYNCIKPFLNNNYLLKDKKLLLNNISESYVNNLMNNVDYINFIKKYNSTR